MRLELLEGRFLTQDEIRAIAQAREARQMSSRRQFLAMAGVASIGLTVAPGLALAQEGTPELIPAQTANEGLLRKASFSPGSPFNGGADLVEVSGSKQRGVIGVDHNLPNWRSWKQDRWHTEFDAPPAREIVLPAYYRQPVRFWISRELHDRIIIRIIKKKIRGRYFCHIRTAIFVSRELSYQYLELTT